MKTRELFNITKIDYYSGVFRGQGLVRVVVIVCLVAKLCLIYCEPVDCSLPGSSVQGISQAARILNGLLFPPPGDLPDPGSNLSLLHWQVDSLSLSHLGIPR